MASSQDPPHAAETSRSASVTPSSSPCGGPLPPTTLAAKREPTPSKGTGFEDLDESNDDDIQYNVMKPKHRPGHPYPLPDLRFEQSYLRSIAKADTWSKVAWITARDQVLMPFVQGILYNLAICGWQHWNRNARLSGNSIGSRVRRWWYGLNNWPVPQRARVLKQL